MTMYESPEAFLASVVREEHGHFYLGDKEISPQSVSDMKGQIVQGEEGYEFSSGVLDPVGP